MAAYASCTLYRPSDALLQYAVDELDASRSPQPSTFRFPATVDLFVALLDAFFAVILPPLDDFAAFPPLDFAMVAAQSAVEGVAVNSSVGGG